MKNPIGASLKKHLREDEKVYLKVGSTVYKGKVIEIEEEGFWLTENEETEEFVSFLDDITEWAIE